MGSSHRRGVFANAPTLPRHPGSLGSCSLPCEIPVLHYAVVFLVIALVAAVLGFGGIAASAAGIAKVLFVVFLVLAVLSGLAGLLRGT